MKKITLALLLIAAPASADNADRWETTYLALSAVDAAQTCDFIVRDKAIEANPIIRAALGKRPKCEEVIAFKAGLGLLHYVLFKELKERDPKFALRMAQVSVAVQGSAVALNLRYTF